jgi:diguanylate cyclase (GGDEF)-like protein
VAVVDYWLNQASDANDEERLHDAIDCLTDAEHAIEALSTVPAAALTDSVYAALDQLRRARSALRATEVRCERLAQQALHDPLTGLPNRALLHDRIEQALLRSERHGMGLALLMIDLDRFKQVNDRFGHQVGDLVLQHAAQQLQGALRASDTLARWGGDEFVVLLPTTNDPQAAAFVADKLLDALMAPVPLGKRTVTLAASIGIALAPQHARDAEALLQAADAAMYVAKRAGGGFGVYEPTAAVRQRSA